MTVGTGCAGAGFGRGEGPSLFCSLRRPCRFSGSLFLSPVAVPSDESLGSLPRPPAPGIAPRITPVVARAVLVDCGRCGLRSTRRAGFGGIAGGKNGGSVLITGPVTPGTPGSSFRPRIGRGCRCGVCAMSVRAGSESVFAHLCGIGGGSDHCTSGREAPGVSCTGWMSRLMCLTPGSSREMYTV